MIPLKEVARQNRPRVSQIELREIVPTKSQSDDLARIYLQIVRHWRDVGARVVAEYDPPALTVDSAPEIEDTLTSGTATANAVILTLTAETDNWVRRLAAWHTRRWAANVRAGTGVSIDQFLTNAAILDDMQASLRWNVSLIRNVSDSTRDRIANIVWAGWKNRTPRRDIARAINEAVGIERRRALRIATDQTTKLSGDLDRGRMLEAGIEDWTWVHSRKLHPRMDHVARNGLEYNWITNRPADLPGELPYCGCKARALMKW